MIQQLSPNTAPNIIYPNSNGQPMSDNTKQLRWIVTIKENLELLFASVANVSIAGDLLWYPVEGNNQLSQAPDVMVVFGRPKSDRGSYKQWEEGNIPPQVVFEILAPGSRLKSIVQKLRFYNDYGVEEYYIYNPDDGELVGWLRREEEDLDVIPEMNNWVSPRLGIRFEIRPEDLIIYRPDGERFVTFVELGQLWERERQRADDAIAQLEALKEKLRQRGLDSED